MAFYRQMFLIWKPIDDVSSTSMTDPFSAHSLSIHKNIRSLTTRFWHNTGSHLFTIFKFISHSRSSVNQQIQTTCGSTTEVESNKVQVLWSALYLGIYFSDSFLLLLPTFEHKYLYFLLLKFPKQAPYFSFNAFEWNHWLFFFILHHSAPPSQHQDRKNVKDITGQKKS